MGNPDNCRAVLAHSFLRVVDYLLVAPSSSNEQCVRHAAAIFGRFAARALCLLRELASRSL